MSEFISLYDVVFGNQSVLQHSDWANNKSAIVARKIPLDVVISTIENPSSRGYWVDKVGRPVAANKIQVKAAINALSTFHEMGPSSRAEFEICMDDSESLSLWHNFGWPYDHFPDFKARHKDWREQNSTMRPIPSAIEAPKTIRSNNAIWHIADIALRIVIENHLAGKRSTDEYIKELMSSTHTTETMRMMNHLQTKGLKLGPEAFREKLKEIFSKQ